jgi:membrane protein required for beta-lactamase induction
MLDPSSRRNQPLVKLAKQYNIPGGVKGIYLGVIVSVVVAVICITFLDFITCIFYFIPIGAILALVYAERELARHEE